MGYLFHVSTETFVLMPLHNRSCCLWLPSRNGFDSVSAFALRFVLLSNSLLFQAPFLSGRFVLPFAKQPREDVMTILCRGYQIVPLRRFFPIAKRSGVLVAYKELNVI